MPVSVSRQPRRAAGIIGLVSSLSLMLAACGGGGAGGGSVDNGAAAAQAAATAAAAAAAQAAKEADAGRLAKQASFGGTPDLVSHIASVGVSVWLDEQFAATGSSYADIAASAVTVGSCGTDNVCFRNKFSREPVAMRFYADALSQPDQLRQRVALALSQILVASDLEVNSSAGLASLNQIFLSNAFGNYRDILMSVTLNGYMGDYLDMADSNKSNPSENYAREMLQLFSMGASKLNMDGTLVTDATGAAVANYTQDDIRGVARALTGWTYARLNGAAITDNNNRDWSKPMIQVAARYDTTAKAFLGTTVAANATQDASVAAAVDAAFNNASTAPYISKQLIQHLVMSNPSTAYVGRVSAVFANNGSNVRGDMKAVIRAILTDSEARAALPAADPYGKVREPILMLTALARAIGMTSDGYVFTTRDTGLGQAVFRSPSVFNFYPPDYPLPGSTMLSPPTKLMTTANVIARHNMVYDWTIGALTTRSEFNVNASVTGSTGSAIDWSGWEGLGTDIDAMIDRIDLILMNRAMTSAQKAALKTAAQAVTNTNAATQARARAQAMLYVVASSPLFQVDR